MIRLENKNYRTEQKTRFATWLKEKYLAWNSEGTELRSRKEFAAHLNISPALLNHYLHKRQLPSKAVVDILANRLGFEVYALLNMSTPNKELRFISSNWGQLNRKQQAAVIRMIGKYINIKGDKL